MGNCVGSNNLEDNVFKVRNINDSRDLVQKGLMEVTQTELVYIDSATKDDWHWPLKYLRKYGCDGDVFTFEAGRKCPGGEGLYAFSTRKASALFELVAKNIQQGELQPPGELSPFNESQALDSSAVLSFPPAQSTGGPAVPPVSTNTDQPSYTNLDIMGNPLHNGDHTSSGNPDSGAVPKSVYREVVFERPPEEHPKPLGNTQKPISYSQIDFEQTSRLNSVEGRGSVVPGPQPSQQGGRTVSTSSHSHHRQPNGASRSGGARSRHNTYTPGNTRDRNKSEGSFSSQGSLSESCRDVRSPRVNGGVAADPNSSMYQNVQVGGGVASGLQEPQQQYQNVTVGAGSVNQVFENGGLPQQQPNYCNITMSSAANSSSIADTSISQDTPTSTNSMRLNGMGNYAQLELSSDVPRTSRSMSSSTVGSSSTNSHHHQSQQPQQQSSYLQLDFNSDGHSSSTSANHTHPANGRRSASVSAVSSSVMSPSSDSRVPMPGIIHQHIPEEEVAIVATPPSSAKPDSSSVKDPTKVEYEMLNFPAMKALVELSTQREQEIEKKKEQIEKEQKEKEKGKKKK